MKSSTLIAAVAALSLLGGCASVPTGPSVMALPGSNRNFNDFRDDDIQCRQYASQQVAGPEHDPAVRDAVIGTAVGALAGAAIGGRNGAGVGAGVGLLFGSVAGADASQRYAYGSQRQYDNTYVQCMYARGHRVPVSGSMARSRIQAPPPPDQSQYYPAPPPPPAYAPPATPPTDYYPPPPPHG